MDFVHRPTLIRLLIAMMVATVVGQRAAADEELTQLVQKLEQHESLVDSVVAEASVVRHPTAPDQIPRVEEALRRMGRSDEFANFVLTDGNARSFDLRIKWWQRDPKVRSEAESSATARRTITCFDGLLVRELTTQQGAHFGAISTAEGATWEKAHRHDLLDFLLGWHGLSYSTLVKTAVTPRVHQARIGTQAMTAVSFQHPTADGVSMDIAFGPNNLPHRVDVTFEIGNWPATLYERWEYADFRRHVLESGETIEFPHTVRFRQCLGSLDDGEIVEYSTNIYTIDSISFNVDIPDHVFSLSFPENAAVYDRVAGYGWTKDPRTVAALNESISYGPVSWFRWSFAILGTAILGCIVLWWLWRRGAYSPAA